jgi:hypothetical protein
MPWLTSSMENFEWEFRYGTNESKVVQIVQWFETFKSFRTSTANEMIIIQRLFLEPL